MELDWGRRFESSLNERAEDLDKVGASTSIWEDSSLELGDESVRERDFTIITAGCTTACRAVQVDRVEMGTSDGEVLGSTIAFDASDDAILEPRVVEATDRDCASSTRSGSSDLKTKVPSRQ